MAGDLMREHGVILKGDSVRLGEEVIRCVGGNQKPELYKPV